VVMQCHYCGRHFVPAKRVGARQKSYGRAECRQKRKKQAQRQWCDRNTECFRGDYWRIKQWRQQEKQSRESSFEPKDKTCRMIQDEIRLRKGDVTTFADYG